MGSAMSAVTSKLPKFEPGHVWLVGAGPGDPGLLTLHAVNALEQADVIVYDALVNEECLSFARPDSEREYAGKRGGNRRRSSGIFRCGWLNWLRVASAFSG